MEMTVCANSSAFSEVKTKNLLSEEGGRYKRKEESTRGGRKAQEEGGRYKRKDGHIETAN